MSEETLNRLFEQARNEAPETKLSDIQKWIGLGGLGILLAGLLTKMKLLVTLKPFIMISSVVVAVGVGTGAILMLNKSDAPKQVNPVETKTIGSNTFPNQDPNPKPNEIALSPIGEDSTQRPQPVIMPDLPVMQIIEDYNMRIAHLPPLNYCLSVPANPMEPAILPNFTTRMEPMKPMEPFQLTRTTVDEIEIDDFSTLKAWGAVDIVLKKGDKASVRVENHDESCDDAIHINTKSNTLEVYSDYKAGKKNNCNVTVYVTVVDLEKINCSGASTIETEGELKLNELDITVSGASEIHMDLVLEILKIDASGASEIVLNGKADEMKLINSGATDFKASGFEVKSATVDCSGASEVSLNVTTHLDIKASGASDVEYTGAATIGTQSITGASDFKHK